MPDNVTVRLPERMVPLLMKPKRVKIAVGGRGGAKSITFGDAFLKYCSDGERLCCAREFQNSIDDSVHQLLQSRISALGASGFTVNASDIEHASGGSIIYKGLARNVDAIRSLYGIKRIWVEEAQTLSERTLEVLLPTIREDKSELWFSLNRGSSRDPFARRMLARHEAELAKHGFYEDDETLIVQINWRDNPWFPEVLNRERLRDLAVLPRARYDHIWEGAYSDTIDNAIILPEWFDACVGAHLKLGFKPRGAEVVAFDPADTGHDAKAIAHRHGAVILHVEDWKDGQVDDACDRATAYANRVKADDFVWDGDGLGAGLKRQISDAFDGTRVSLRMFRGSAEPDRPDAIHDPIDGEVAKAKTNRDTFYNLRAQRYWDLRDRMFRTYQAVAKGQYHDPDSLLSFAPSIPCLAQLRAEVCRIPRKENGAGRLQIMSKVEMRSKGIDSPNCADALMMTLSAGNATLKAAPAVEVSIPRAFSAWR